MIGAKSASQDWLPQRQEETQERGRKEDMPYDLLAVVVLQNPFFFALFACFAVQ